MREIDFPEVAPGKVTRAGALEWTQYRHRTDRLARIWRRPL